MDEQAPYESLNGFNEIRESGATRTTTKCCRVKSWFDEDREEYAAGLAKPFDAVPNKTPMKRTVQAKTRMPVAILIKAITVDISLTFYSAQISYE
ncbi:hypothetical protein ALC56_05380 [Trachymyrmex septentrionalis]|uniref:Uncharacterized protein n=1 Tax=Trachymyrmex septentrionalis TaxID=34720 RepID=A0A195FIE0_9HYME|nr:hypothetical protein ALC56_05380 [Trachymyrmex septentrionalis]